MNTENKLFITSRLDDNRWVEVIGNENYAVMRIFDNSLPREDQDDNWLVADVPPNFVEGLVEAGYALAERIEAYKEDAQDGE